MTAKRSGPAGPRRSSGAEPRRRGAAGGRARAAGYVLSLPERALRSMSAVSGGLLRELGDAALPLAVRRTKLYRTMVADTLRFLIEQVGEVQGTYPLEGAPGDDFVVRRTVGNGLELIGILTFRAPLSIHLYLNLPLPVPCVP